MKIATPAAIDLNYVNRRIHVACTSRSSTRVVAVVRCFEHARELIMRLRAIITIDIEARGFADAAAHQERLEGLHLVVRGHYEQARMDLRERRPRAKPRLDAGEHLHSGHAVEYEE